MYNEDMKTKIGRRLRAIRENKKLTLKTVVNLFPLYLTTDKLSKYERGARGQDIEFLDKFAKYYKINMNWLIGGVGPWFNDQEKEIRPPEEILGELIGALKERSAPEPVKLNKNRITLEEITGDSDKNYLNLLQKMKSDEDFRKNVLKLAFGLQLS